MPLNLSFIQVQQILTNFLRVISIFIDRNAQEVPNRNSTTEAWRPHILIQPTSLAITQIREELVNILRLHHLLLLSELLQIFNQLALHVVVLWNTQKYSDYSSIQILFRADFSIVIFRNFQQEMKVVDAQYLSKPRSHMSVFRNKACHNFSG